MFKERDRVRHPRLGYGEIILIITQKLKNYDEETIYVILINGMIRKIRYTSNDYKDIKLVERSL